MVLYSHGKLSCIATTKYVDDDTRFQKVNNSNSEKAEKLENAQAFLRMSES